MQNRRNVLCWRNSYWISCNRRLSPSALSFSLQQRLISFLSFARKQRKVKNSFVWKMHEKRPKYVSIDAVVRKRNKFSFFISIFGCGFFDALVIYPRPTHGSNRHLQQHCCRSAEITLSIMSLYFRCLRWHEHWARARPRSHKQFYELFSVLFWHSRSVFLPCLLLKSA